MNVTEPAEPDIRTLDWEDQGDNDWTATAPGGWALTPATPTALRPDPDRLYSHGYVLDVMVEDRPVVRALTLDEGKLALEGRLCLAGVVVEGLRGLRYVKGVRTWTCRPGEPSHIPPPSPLPATD